jgi:hypothetical protein
MKSIKNIIKKLLQSKKKKRGLNLIEKNSRIIKFEKIIILKIKTNKINSN